MLLIKEYGAEELAGRRETSAVKVCRGLVAGRVVCSLLVASLSSYVHLRLTLSNPGQGGVQVRSDLVRASLELIELYAALTVELALKWGNSVNELANKTTQVIVGSGGLLVQSCEGLRSHIELHWYVPSKAFQLMY